MKTMIRKGEMEKTRVKTINIIREVNHSQKSMSKIKKRMMERKLILGRMSTKMRMTKKMTKMKEINLIIKDIHQILMDIRVEGKILKGTSIGLKTRRKKKTKKNVRKKCAHLFLNRDLLK